MYIWIYVCVCIGIANVYGCICIGKSMGQGTCIWGVSVCVCE